MDVQYSTIGSILNKIRAEEYFCLDSSPDTIKIVNDMWPEDYELVFKIGKNAYDSLFRTNLDIGCRMNKMGEDNKNFVIHRCVLALQQTFQKAVTFFYERSCLNVESSIQQFSADMQFFGAKFRYLVPSSRVWDLKCLLNKLTTNYVEEYFEQNEAPPDDPEFLEKLGNALSQIVSVMRIHMAFGYEYTLYGPTDDEIKIIGKNKHEMVLPGITAAGSFIELAQQFRRRNDAHNLERHHSEQIHINEIMIEMN